MQRKTTTTNHTRTHNTTPRLHKKTTTSKTTTYYSKEQSKRYGEAFRRFRNKLAKKLNDPTIHNNTTLRPQTLLLHKTTQTNTKHRNRKTNNGTQTTQHHTKISTPTRLRKREWIVEGTTRQRTSQTTT